MIIKPYKQTTYETCLAVTLMLLLNIKPNKNKEISIWKAGWEFNFLIGQVNYVSQKYNKKIKVLVENKNYFKELLKIKKNHVSLENIRITEALINLIAENKNLIIYIDNYFLNKTVHAPHFIILESIQRENSLIFDPWEGKIKKIKNHVLYEAIYSLKYHLNFSPILIYEDI